MCAALWSGCLRTAYAMRSPLGSVDSTVGCPLVVLGRAAQMASGYILAQLVMRV